MDSPLGDLNHDGSVTDTLVSNTQFSNASLNELWPAGAQANEAHYYAECSGAGTCDRMAGECRCFAGYTGHACQRTLCPRDCSGHGVCRTLKEIASGALNRREISSMAGEDHFEGVETAFTYNLWDAEKHQACVCDPGYSGYSCSLRECPRGDDPLTTGPRWTGNEDASVAKMQFTLGAAPGESIIKFGFKGWDGRLNSAFASIYTNRDAPGISLDGQYAASDTVAGKIMMALRSMPGGLLKSVVVTSPYSGVPAATTCTPGSSCTYTITLHGRPGKQTLVTVTSVRGAAILAAPTYVTASGKALDGNEEEITCSGRGLCDYDTGLCKCFMGYFGAACEHQNALATGSQ